MASFVDNDDDDRDLAGSQDGSSENDNDNDMDVTMQDADDADGDNENNKPDLDADADPDQDAESSSITDQVSEAQQNPAIPPSTVNATAASMSVFHPPVRAECLTATTYDIVPTTAAPHSTSINAISATADMRWVFSGGSDGYIRKFNWVESVNGKLMLTVAQRHPFVDCVIKAGVVMTYWENMDGNALSPVYSLACHSEGLWLLSGLESGCIKLQSVRHEEGKEIATLQQHNSAVSVLTLSSDEKSLLSGSWDKRVLDWDLNTGQIRRSYGSSARQISAIEFRPESSLPVPRDTVEPQLSNGTYSSNNEADGLGAFSFMDGGNTHDEFGAGPNPQAGSPVDSLFGGADSLFGDGDGGVGDGTGASGPFGMDSSFGETLTNGIVPETGLHEEPNHTNGLTNLSGSLENTNPDANALSGISNTKAEAEDPGMGLPNGISSEPAVNHLPHAEDLEQMPRQTSDASQPSQSAGDTTFLAASIDGTIRIWDRRQPDPVARISPHNAPPWCMNACWSPNGDYVYAGRRNGTVEEFSLHKGLRSAERVFKFPQGSGPVTALKAMPNGRHLVCASHDILRLYDLRHEQTSHRSTVPFLIIPGHRTGLISQLYIDQACRFMISAGGHRGWEGSTTEVLLGYEIGVPR
ncbi:Transcription factor spt8 [Monascus purpureus]|uniref:Transcription factor spt8 n=1 Tax=Monascus purpureus TaxID=5098 RepID=A0A507R4E6_MONPU|nr:Transcription factor spt8 [Monascus purpureus]BDD56321.1 hypothetical protein MAP00_001792 [Monascus purpureus]